MLRARDVPYPSISLVLSQAEKVENDSHRLPAYRESHLLRFHPYPRVHQQTPRRRNDALMQTVDYRHEDNPVLPVLLPCIAESDVEDLENLERAIHNKDAGSFSKRRRRLSGLIIELALAVRRRWQGIHAVEKSQPPTKLDLLD